MSRLSSLSAWCSMIVFLVNDDLLSLLPLLLLLLLLHASGPRPPSGVVKLVVRTKYIGIGRINPRQSASNGRYSLLFTRRAQFRIRAKKIMQTCVRNYHPQPGGYCFSLAQSLFVHKTNLLFISRAFFYHATSTAPPKKD